MHYSSILLKRRSAQAHPAGRARRRLLAAATLLTTLTAVATLGAATAEATSAKPATSTVGDPQPELAQFKVGGNSGTGSGIVLANGDLVLGFGSSSGDSITVCVLHPGDRKCASTATLKPPAGETFGGIPEVLSTGGTEVSVVVSGCCSSSVSATTFTYNSSNGGKAFSPFVQAGVIDGLGAGTTANGQFVVSDYSAGSFTVQAFPPHPSSVVTATATPNNQIAGDVSLTTYHGGVLAASDNLTSTYVEYAKSGSDYNASSSYKSVGKINNEQTVTVSGNALLTDPGGSLTGGDRLRFFSGTSFGKANKVPDAKPTDDGYFTMQETGSTVHVFFLDRDQSYDVFSETTKNGSSWSALQQYGTAITADQLVSVLGPTGAGVVLEAGTGSSPVLAQPILNPQFVSIALKQSKVKPGHSTKLTGTVRPQLKNQLVTLELKSGKDWLTVTTTHESASGTFSFTVPGKAETYRAVVAYQPGYYLYGYSNSVTLAVS